MPHNTMLKRIRPEYLEMPGLRLTLEQVQRLCGVERALCKMVLDALVDEKFLSLKPSGTYARVTDSADHQHPTPAKADLRAEERSMAASWACRKATFHFTESAECCE